jgi:hypothetical protein
MEQEIISYPPLEQLEDTYMTIKNQVQNLKEQLNITEDSDDSLPDSPIIDIDVNEDEEEYSTSDEENEENTV